MGGVRSGNETIKVTCHMSRAALGSLTTARKFGQSSDYRYRDMHDQPTSTMSADPRPPTRRQSSGENRDAKDHHHHHATSNHKKMAAQSQGIKQLMAAEKEAAQVVANARKRKDAIADAYQRARAI